MAEVIPINGQGCWRNDYRYAVYEHKLVTADGMIYPRSFIVIKNRYGVIIRFTRLHNFAGAYENRVYRQMQRKNSITSAVCSIMYWLITTAFTE